jgi:hypothetical protein
MTTTKTHNHSTEFSNNWWIIYFQHLLEWIEELNEFFLLLFKLLVNNSQILQISLIIFELFQYLSLLLTLQILIIEIITINYSQIIIILNLNHKFENHLIILNSKFVINLIVTTYNHHYSFRHRIWPVTYILYGF